MKKCEFKVTNFWQAFGLSLGLSLFMTLMAVLLQGYRQKRADQK